MIDNEKRKKVSQIFTIFLVIIWTIILVTAFKIDGTQSKELMNKPYTIEQTKID